MNKPFISIITVCYNAADVLKGTIESLEKQTDQDFEYIVIDGGSKDDTLQIIEEHSGSVTKWITERDRGIYDAMNKGLQMASGTYVWFLNAGDQAFDGHVVEILKSAAADNPDVLYGEVMIVDGARNHLGTRSEITVHKLPDNLTKHSMALGMVVCHQAFIPRRELAPMFMMDNLSADIDWTIRVLDKAGKVEHTKIVIAEYLAGGVSKQQWRRSLKDRFDILARHFGIIPTVFNHFRIVVRAAMHKRKRRGKHHY